MARPTRKRSKHRDAGEFGPPVLLGREGDWWACVPNSMTDEQAQEALRPSGLAGARPACRRASLVVKGLRPDARCSLHPSRRHLVVFIEVQEEERCDDDGVQDMSLEEAQQQEFDEQLCAEMDCRLGFKVDQFDK